MTQEVLFATLGVCAVLLTVTLGGVGWQAAMLLAELRKELIPRAATVLEDVQSNLTQVQQLTRDVDTTVTHTNEIVDTVRRGVGAIETGVQQATLWTGRYLRDKAAVVSLGLSTAWQTYRSKRGKLRPAVQAVAVNEDVVSTDAVTADETRVAQEAIGSLGSR